MELKYEQFKTKKGNEYRVANTHVGTERPSNVSIAEFLADRGHSVTLLHNGIDNKAIYENVMPKGSKFPCHADATIDHEIWEFKNNETGRWKTLKREISEAHNQADNVLIRFEHPMSDEELLRHVKGAIMSTKGLKKVWILRNNEIKIFERETL